MSEEKVLNKQHMKVVFLGDGAVGKTCLGIRMATGTLPGEYIPTVFDNHSVTETFGKETVQIAIWDTGGKEDYDRLRPLSYPETTVFLMCFSSTSPSSLENLTNKWIPELQHHGYDQTGYIIVQTKCDLYEEKEKKRNFDRTMKAHPKILAHYMHSAHSDTDNDDWMPLDLFRLMLKFAEYTEAERNYDRRIVEALIDETEIEQAVKNELKFGLYSKDKKAPFIRTSSLTGFNIDDKSLANCILKNGRRYQNSIDPDSKRTCQIM